MKNKIIIGAVIIIIVAIVAYFLTYDEPIHYGEGNLDPTAEDVIMFDNMDDESYTLHDAAKDVAEIRFDIEEIVKKLEAEEFKMQKEKFIEEVDNEIQ